MMDLTDRHCRVLHRTLSRRARLYTEMITTAALLHGDVARHLDFDPAEHPVALQLGGCEPAELAACARLAQRWGYDEVNLNCGCPSERVQRGRFGACLMAEPGLVADCVRALLDAVSIPVTVKHRIGIDCRDDYGFVRDFVGALHEAGCRVFIVHARSAWLKGLSPKENREVPPLRHDTVFRLKRDFAGATFVLNGGLQSLAAARQALREVDGVMLGRAAYQDPFLLAQVDAVLFGDPDGPTRSDVVDAMGRYLSRRCAAGTPARAVTRHLLGLYLGQRGARQWRRLLSDPDFLQRHGAQALAVAQQAMGRPDAVALRGAHLAASA